MESTVKLTEKQQARVASFKAALEAVIAQIKPLQQQEQALRMGVESTLATVLECCGASEQDKYQLSEDGTTLMLVEEEQRGVAQPS